MAIKRSLIIVAIIALVHFALTIFLIALSARAVVYNGTEVPPLLETILQYLYVVTVRPLEIMAPWLFKRLPLWVALLFMYMYSFLISSFVYAVYVALSRLYHRSVTK